MLDAETVKTVLVTGGTGFVGSHLVRRLETMPHLRLVLLSRQAPRHPLPEHVTWVTAPLQALSSATWQALGIPRFDLVFHLGGFTPKNGAEINQVDAIYEHTLLGIRALLDSLVTPPVRLVLASTVDVYTIPTDGVPLTENANLAGSSLHGAAKLFCEQLGRVYARKHGCGLAILRYGHIFGPGEEAYQKLIPNAIRQLLRGEAPVLQGDGSAERDYLFIEDVVEATWRAAQSDIGELGPVNIVRGASLPIRTVITMLIQLTEYPGQPTYKTDQPPGYSLRFAADRMHQLLGTWPLISVEEGLRREVEHAKARLAR